MEQAVGAARFIVRKDAVQAAAALMLEQTGTIDMKQLAGAVGISRASLYRSYPDKLAVETSIAADLARRMSAAADRHDGFVDRLQAVIEVLLEDPAGAAALAPVVAAVDFDLIAESAEVLVGRASAAPVIIGFATLIASAHRRSALDEVRVVLDQTIAQYAILPD